MKTPPRRSVPPFCLFREVGIWRSRAGSVSQRAFAPDGRDSTSTLRYMDAAVRRDEGKLCFVKRKSNDLVSKCRRFWKKNVSFFEKRERSNKNLWTFLRNAPSFFFFSPAFLEKTPVPRSRCHPRFPHPHSRTRERTRPCASRTQRVRNSCLHPSPSPASRWHSVCCAWRKCSFFSFTGEGKRGETFTRKSLFPRCLQSYGEEVKAKNEKQRTRALRVRVGGWSGRPVHFWERASGSWGLTPNVGRTNFKACAYTGCPVKCVFLLMPLVFFQFAKQQSRLKSCKRASVLFLSPKKITDINNQKQFVPLQILYLLIVLVHLVYSL